MSWSSSCSLFPFIFSFGLKIDSKVQAGAVLEEESLTPALILCENITKLTQFYFDHHFPKVGEGQQGSKLRLTGQ